MTRRLALSLLFLLLGLANAASAAPGGFTIVNALRVCTNQTPSLKFDWTPASGATSYAVLRDEVVVLASTTNTTYEDTNVTSGETHTYRVIASDESGSTPSSNSETMTVPYCTPPDAPVASAAVICQSAAPAVQLEWTPVARAESYDVFRNGIQIRSNLSPDTSS